MQKFLIGLAVVALTGVAQAERAYVGGALGMTSLKIDCTGTSDCKTHNSGAKLYAGLKLTPYLAGELAYADFGKGSYTSGTISGEGKVSAIIVDAAFRYAFVPEFVGILRVGAARVDSSGTATVAGYPAQSVGDTEMKPYYGLGFEYHFDKHWSAVGAADYTKAQVGGVKAKIEMYSIGAQVDF